MGKVFVDIGMPLDGFIAGARKAAGSRGLFDHLGTQNLALERIEVVDSPAVTHLAYRVLK